ncbi:MAG: hypothetical protein JW839_00695 [Candidatus Lokiarchaeota archaeon]|nr:hypothetical protein [Candidatus Lokiarchaeota archaeon]
MPMPAEDVIFYFDLGVRGIVSKKAIVKAVQHFIKEKEKENPGSNWGVVAFKHDEDNPQFHEGLARDEEALEPFLKDNLKFVTKAHPLEQGLMLASTYLVDAYRTTRNHVLRMIVISDGPTEGSSANLVTALMDLLDTIKHFPVFIDIIRVGDERVYPDDVKLKTIAEVASGKVYYAATDDAFKDIIETLLSASPASPMPGVRPLEKRAYFEGLCWSLLETGIPGASCLACGKGEQSGTLLQCENCGAPYHGHCASEVALREYEAFPGIFRCKKCDCLLNTESRRIVIPSTRPAGAPAKPAKAEPVRLVINAPGFACEEKAPAVSFTVKAMPVKEQSKPKAITPPSLSMKPPPSAKPAPVKPADPYAEDIKIIGSDECLTVGAGEKRGGGDGIVIVEEKPMTNPASFWKREKD